MSEVPSGAWAPRSQACCVETRFIEGRAASRSASTGGISAAQKTGLQGVWKEQHGCSGIYLE